MRSKPAGRTKPWGHGYATFSHLQRGWSDAKKSKVGVLRGGPGKSAKGVLIRPFGDAILGRQPLPDALTWHCASSLQTNDTGREERKFHCGLHKAIQGARRLAARLDERRHQCALLDLSQTIPHCGFAYLSRTARPTKDEDRGSAAANGSPHDNALRRQCIIELLRSKSGPPHNPPRRLDCGFGPARRSLGRPATTASTTKRECS